MAKGGKKLKKITPGPHLCNLGKGKHHMGGGAREPHLKWEKKPGWVSSVGKKQKK